MFTSTIKGFERFKQVGADIDALTLKALAEAADEAATVATERSRTIRLELETIPAHPTVDGAFAGIRSGKKGKRGIRLAPIFDEGTLGQHRGKLKRGRRDHWQVNRKGTTYTAQRHAITPEEGIEAERFFPAARRAGRKALLARLDRGLL